MNTNFKLRQILFSKYYKFFNQNDAVLEPSEYLLISLNAYTATGCSLLSSYNFGVIYEIGIASVYSLYYSFILHRFPNLHGKYFLVLHFIKY